MSTPNSLEKPPFLSASMLIYNDASCFISHDKLAYGVVLVSYWRTSGSVVQRTSS